MGIQLKMFRKQLTKQFRGLSITHVYGGTMWGLQLLFGFPVAELEIVYTLPRQALDYQWVREAGPPKCGPFGPQNWIFKLHPPSLKPHTKTHFWPISWLKVELLTDIGCITPPLVMGLCQGLFVINSDQYITFFYFFTMHVFSFFTLKAFAFCTFASVYLL